MDFFIGLKVVWRWAEYPCPGAAEAAFCVQSPPELRRGQHQCSCSTHH